MWWISALKALLRTPSTSPGHEPLVVRVVLDDIVRQDTDAIVNAADATLLGGTGVDGAIHAAAGPELGKACVALGGCREGMAKATPGFRLPARHVIHTVAPVWIEGASGRLEKALEDSLASCFVRSMRLADQMCLASLSFPMLGAGVFGWVAEDVARVAKASVDQVSGTTRALREVRFVAFGPNAMRSLEGAFGVRGEVRARPECLRYHAGVSALG